MNFCSPTKEVQIIRLRSDLSLGSIFFSNTESQFQFIFQNQLFALRNSRYREKCTGISPDNDLFTCIFLNFPPAGHIIIFL